jgi:hypothetical protein
MELIGTWTNIQGRVLVRSRTGSYGRRKHDPGCLRSGHKVTVGYVVEDIKMHHLQKESPQLVG